MFDTDIKFTGSQANILKKYSKTKQSENTISFILKNVNNNNIDTFIFDTSMDCYMIAAMIGIINNKRSKKSGEGSVTIFHEKISKCKVELNTISRFANFINNENITVEENIKKSFTATKSDDKEAEVLIDEYVRGGLDVIDNYFKECQTVEDFCSALYLFKEDYFMIEINKEV
ncbi:MAG: hypothetical protein R3Y60_04945 [bacterium]